MVLGSGALKIGQAGEFDYSGAQALKALREEGIRTVLVNPNIATVQTSEGVADKIYFLPVTPEFVTKVIEKERPDGILLAFGGQTALNCGVALYRNGVLEKYGVRVLGTPVESIMDTEDRELFVKRLDEIDVKTIKSHAAEDIDSAVAAAEEVGYPVIVRAAYALGGLGSGFCNDAGELVETCRKSFNFSPQVLVEKSLKGWKEIEFEVVRDASDRCIVVCDMENFDPLGIHTGESVVVAPTKSLTAGEIDFLHDLSIRIVRHLGIVGECNIQFAFAPDGSMDYRVIEVNARLSRSSALASKATGYPLAFVAAKIAMGYDLTEIGDAAVPPSVDYVVCKIPRWDLAKFHGVSHEIGTTMKSVGEVMAIGGSFEEAIQKGIRMIGQGANGFVCQKKLSPEEMEKELLHPTDHRLFALAAAFESGYTVEQVADMTKISGWFLERLYEIENTYRRLERVKGPDSLTKDLLLKAKGQGFSDVQIARVLGCKPAEIAGLRDRLKVRPAVRKIKTLSTGGAKGGDYLYLTYSTNVDEVEFGMEDTAIVLGSGAYRIGSSVEFDWCSVNTLNTLRSRGKRAIMINCNPETVSTDYDVCDRLYFDELSFETVMEIHRLEKPFGVVVSVGGQIPNNLALPLEQAGVKLLGTPATHIDMAEDRNKFSSIMDRIGVDQPRWSELTARCEVEKFVAEVGFPVLVRPSYVLSGAAMNVCYNMDDLWKFLDMASEVSAEHPVVISSFLSRCREMEFDAVADHGKVLCYGISEHIEYAGVHSGDATIQFPARKLYAVTAAGIRKIARKIAEALDITGPFNIQFLVGTNYIKVIECNLRASRSFPFVSKIMKVNFIDLATRCMLGEHPDVVDVDAFDLEYVGVKSSQFSFSRLGLADPVPGVDMSSTGEVGCIGDNLDEALLKSMISVGYKTPEHSVLVSSGNAIQKADLLGACQLLDRNGYEIYATEGTYKYLIENGVSAKKAVWPGETVAGEFPVVTDLIKEKKVDLVVNLPKNFSRNELTNGYKVRRAAIDFNVPLITNSRLATAYIRAFCSMKDDDLKIKSWDEYR